MNTENNFINDQSSFFSHNNRADTCKYIIINVFD